MAQFGNVGYLPLVNDILEVKLFTEFEDQLGVNVIHTKVIAVAGTGADFSAALTYLWSTYRPHWRALVNNNCRVARISIQKVFPLPRGAAAYDDTSATDGTGGADPIPAQVSGIITRFTALAGRKYRGRVYIPFPATVFNATDDTPSAAYVTALDLFADDITGTDEIGAGGNTFQMQSCIFHRADNTSTPTLNWRSNKKWATQRRRGNYGQPNVF